MQYRGVSDTIGTNRMLTEEQTQELLAASPAPRVTVEHIQSRIDYTKYLHCGLTTLCFIHMKNGFQFIGHSTPASPENYRADIGEKYAYDNAFRQIWTHEGYLLREKLSGA
jgi:hypothetical protein